MTIQTYNKRIAGYQPAQARSVMALSVHVLPCELADNGIQTKQCCSCKDVKPLDEFHNNKKNKDGKQGKCKECTNKYSSKYRKKNIKKLRAKRNYNCKKYKAQQMVRTAVKKGVLIKTNCEQCGSEEMIIGHHDDYDRPLDVRWLCPACHGLWHSEHGEALNAK